MSFGIISLPSLLLLPWINSAAGRYRIHKPGPKSLTSCLSFLIILIIQAIHKVRSCACIKTVQVRDISKVATRLNCYSPMCTPRGKPPVAPTVLFFLIRSVRDLVQHIAFLCNSHVICIFCCVIEELNDHMGQLWPDLSPPRTRRVASVMIDCRS